MPNAEMERMHACSVAWSLQDPLYSTSLRSKIESPTPLNKPDNILEPSLPILISRPQLVTQYMKGETINPMLRGSVCHHSRTMYFLKMKLSKLLLGSALPKAAGQVCPYSWHAQVAAWLLERTAQVWQKGGLANPKFRNSKKSGSHGRDHLWNYIGLELYMYNSQEQVLSLVQHMHEVFLIHLWASEYVHPLQITSFHACIPSSRCNNTISGPLYWYCNWSLSTLKCIYIYYIYTPQKPSWYPKTSQSG